MVTEQEIEDALDNLRGPRERFRELITDKDEILAACMDYFEKIAKKRRLPAWSIVSDVTNHGSGVSSAIYNLYRRKSDKQQE
jgi:hypothetical protein